MTTLADVIAAVERHYPTGTAESWDAVGLAVGTRSAPVSKVLYTVDVTQAVVDEALEVGADLILAHHPLFLRPVHAVDLDSPKGQVVAQLIRHGISLYVAHTNADIPPGGTVDALATALGLTDTRPLRPSPMPSLDKVVTFVPSDHLDAVLDALAAAGAGAIGAYDRCAFTSPGTGTFRPLAGADPYVGRVGEVEVTPEVRLEMVLPRAARSAVVAALLAAHPYEEVAYDVLELASLPSPDTGLGRVGTVPGDLSLGAFADRVRSVLPRTGGGIRVSGDRDRRLSRVAVQAGAGDDLLDVARAAGADVYLT
ncbi:MAG: Nif3-like dinuclear metal center hexameric protein, partial [Propionibacteriaceae bacterium]